MANIQLVCGGRWLAIHFGQAGGAGVREGHGTSYVDRGRRDHELTGERARHGRRVDRTSCRSPDRAAGAHRDVRRDQQQRDGARVRLDGNDAAPGQVGPVPDRGHLAASEIAVQAPAHRRCSGAARARLSPRRPQKLAGMRTLAPQMLRNGLHGK